METLVIITPKGGLFAQNLSLSCRFKMTSASDYFVYFTYIGHFPPKQKVLQILSTYNFSDFSLVKDIRFLRLTVYFE